VGETRVTIQEAARILGVSEGAIRKRVKRDTLRHEKAPDGRVYVYLDAGIDGGVDSGVDELSHPDATALISELRAHNATLREQIEAERQAHAEARRIIAGLVERIPAIEAPQEATEPPSEATEQPGRVGPQPAVEGDQEAQESHEMHMPEVHGGPREQPAERPWWRRVFGG
jgi:transposase-like protein